MKCSSSGFFLNSNVCFSTISELFFLIKNPCKFAVVTGKVDNPNYICILPQKKNIKIMSSKTSGLHLAAESLGSSWGHLPYFSVTKRWGGRGEICPISKFFKCDSEKKVTLKMLAG